MTNISHLSPASQPAPDPLNGAGGEWAHWAVELGVEPETAAVLRILVESAGRERSGVLAAEDHLAASMISPTASTASTVGAAGHLAAAKERALLVSDLIEAAAMSSLDLPAAVVDSLLTIQERLRFGRR